MLYLLLLNPLIVALMEILKGAELNAWVQFIIFNWKLVHFSIFVVPPGQRGDGEVPWPTVGTPSDSHFFPFLGVDQPV